MEIIINSQITVKCDTIKHVYLDHYCYIAYVLMLTLTTLILEYQTCLINQELVGRNSVLKY